MGSKFGFWMVLGASALVATVAGCGGDDGSTASPVGGGSSAGGAAGEAGAGGGTAAGSGGSAGQGGAAGGGAAGASTAGGAGGSAGKAGAAAGGQSGASGSATAGAGGASSAGGSAGGGGSGPAGGGGAGGASQGGSAGAGGGGGGSGPSDEALLALGAACSKDSDCGGGGICMLADGTDWGGAGPANGYCTIDCTAFLELSKSGSIPAGTKYPCDPTVDAADVLADLSHARAMCVDATAKDTDPAKGRCMLGCIFGDPPLASAGGQLSPDKCQGRSDVACSPTTDPSTGALQFSFCRPLCQSDDDCGAGTRCDIALGACVKAETLPGTLKPNGQACDPTAAERQCIGACVPLHDASAPDNLKKRGICFDLCEAGAPYTCGGVNHGYCGLFNLYSPDTNPDPSAYSPIALGAQDLAVCSDIVVKGDDSQCLTADGWFAYTFKVQGGGSVAFCLPSDQCQVDADCAHKCTVSEDCPPGDVCEGGKCKKSDGTLDSGNRTCRSVPSVCGRSYCVDHDPSGFAPVTDAECAATSGG